MKEDTPANLAKELKPFANAIKESLPQIKNIVLAPIAFGVAFLEKTLKDASVQRHKAKEREEARLIKDKKEEQAFLERQLKEKNEMKIAEEIRAEQREIRLYNEQNKLTPRRIIHTCLALTSTIAIIVGVVQLFPIAQRSRTVNECIDELSKTNKKMTVAERTFYCNKSK